MSDAPTYPFASPEWLAAHHGVVVGSLVEWTRALEGRPFSMCEVYNEIPAHINGSSSVAWHFRLQDGGLAYEAREVDDVDFKLIADWGAIAPAATVTTDNAAAGAEAMEVMNKGIADGRVRLIGDMTTLPAFLRGMHDNLGRLTRP